MKKILAIICAAFIAGSIFGNSLTPAKAESDTRTTSTTTLTANAKKASKVRYSRPTIALPMNFSSQTSTASTSTATMKVTVNASCISNNSVGNEWSETFAVNGNSVRSGDTIPLKAGDTITVSAKVTEYDDGGDDVGTGSASRTLKQSDIDNGFSLSFNVRVTENGGRYSGNTADWSVTYSFH